jgi:hypothetical protein
MAEQVCMAWYFILIYCIIFTVVGIAIANYTNMMDKRTISNEEFVEISQV